ncbi:MAG: VOC family protein [Devosia sp.]
MTTKNTCVWFEIPVADLDRARAFYGTVLGRELNQQDGGPNPMVAFSDMADPGVSGHLYPGKPAASGNGPTIHLAAPDSLAATAERVRQAGGQVVSDPIEIPSGSFFYATDPDGNSVGFFTT